MGRRGHALAAEAHLLPDLAVGVATAQLHAKLRRIVGGGRAEAGCRTAIPLGALAALPGQDVLERVHAAALLHRAGGVLRRAHRLRLSVSGHDEKRRQQGVKHEPHWSSSLSARGP